MEPTFYTIQNLDNTAFLGTIPHINKEQVDNFLVNLDEEARNKANGQYNVFSGRLTAALETEIRTKNIDDLENTYDGRKAKRLIDKLNGRGEA